MVLLFIAIQAAFPIVSYLLIVSQSDVSARWKSALRTSLRIPKLVI